MANRLNSYLFHNAVIYTVDADFSIAGAVAVEEGVIRSVGPSEQLLKDYSHLPCIDLKGAYVYPGLIDAHCHFLWYGLMKKEVDLRDTSSYQEMLQRLAQKSHETRGWLLGRGWDQTKWPDQAYPRKEPLDEWFPEQPALLLRVDGHAAVANTKALELAGVTGQGVEGGLIETNGGQPTGLLIDKAIDLVRKVIPPHTEEDKRWALQQAEQDCFAVGLTTVDDAQMDAHNIEMMHAMHLEGRLRMNVYAMLMATQANKDWLQKRGMITTERLTVRALKQFADGALGSRGALLVEPYSDDPKNTGLQLEDQTFYRSNVRDALENGWQVNTHCIGDAAVRNMLELYGSSLKGSNGNRWRIEHCQVVQPQDFQLFGKYAILPSVQPSHATSDMGWVEERLGPERAKSAYANRKLLDSAGRVAVGSDFPIEGVNPIQQFHAAVFRQNEAGDPEGGFLPEQKITREQALKGMTTWAAYANFEEHKKGSLEPGKNADLVVTDRDLIKASSRNVRNCKVLMTIVQGELVYEA